MAYLNRFTCIGRLVETPRTAATQNTGANVAHFTMAINRRYKKQDGNTVDETTFIDVEAWRGLADYARNYLDKGMEIYCEGRLSIQKYTDQNNVPREKPIVTLDSLQLLTRTAAQEAAIQQGGNTAQAPAQTAQPRMPQPQMAPYRPPAQNPQQPGYTAPQQAMPPMPAFQQQPAQQPAGYPAQQPMAQQPMAQQPMAQQPMAQAAARPMGQQPPAAMPPAGPLPPSPNADMGDLPF